MIESTLTVPERNQATQHKARAELIKSASSDWKRAKANGVKAAGLEVATINLLRSCGLKLQEAAGHEQVKFDFFRLIANELPKDMTFKGARFCVHLARNFSEPIKTLDEARSARQMMFEAFGAATAPKRLESQNAHERNPWNEFVSLGASFTSMFDELSEEPMEAWTSDKLGTFIRTTKPVVDAHQKAVGLAAR